MSKRGSGGAVRLEAILLLGPTGAGKTPLGEALEAQGLDGRRCAHLDFGQQLRAAAAAADRGRRLFGLTARQVAVVRDALQTGALLEDETFPIARAIVHGFARTRRLGGRGLLVLNGMPRHAGQARDLAADVAVCRVVSLDATAAVVSERIRLNAGGDRAGRKDDSPAEVARKLRIFRKRTLPLLDHYRTQGVEVVAMKVQVNTGPEDILVRLRRCRAAAAGGARRGAAHS